MASKNINLKQLSQELGLSQTTVSRALNGFPEVNQKTRARVLEAARIHNYRPSQSASSLATGKTGQIGHVVATSDHAMINPHFSDFIAGAGEVYAKAGFEMLLRVARAGEEEDIYRDFASRNRVDGVVVHGPLTNDPRIPLLRDLGLPFVVHGRTADTVSEYSWLDVDNRRAFKKAAEFLIDLGHEKIALINGLEAMNFAHRRRAGYEEGLRARGIEPKPSLVTSQDMVEPYGYQATKEFLGSANPPTAIMFSSILPALGGVRALSDLGIKPGRDVSIVTFDDQLSFLQANGERPNADKPYFSCVTSSLRKAGNRVAEILLEKINKPEIAHVQELWEAELVIGETTAKRVA